VGGHRGSPGPSVTAACPISKLTQCGGVRPGPGHLCVCGAAFQIPYDATVRVSLDTHLNMFLETGWFADPDDPQQRRWYRDPNKPIPPEHTTHFPHAVLEVKLEIKVGCGKRADSW
jgi:hypothetical protein